MTTIDSIVKQLNEFAEDTLKASDLHAQGYEPYHHYFRRQVEGTNLYVCYREVKDHFEFACVMRYKNG